MSTSQVEVEEGDYGYLSGGNEDETHPRNHRAARTVVAGKPLLIAGIRD